MEVLDHIITKEEWARIRKKDLADLEKAKKEAAEKAEDRLANKGLGKAPASTSR